MLEIYFDNVLIDSDYYISLKSSNKLFDSTFMLGSVPCETLTLEVPSSLNIPLEVYIKEGSNDYGHYIVDKAEYKDGDVLELTLINSIILSNKNYDAHDLLQIKDEAGETCTTLDIFKDICTTFNLDYDETGFTINNDVIVDFYDNSIQGREYLSFLAEINAGYMLQESDGVLRFKRFNTTPVEINTEECENFKIGQRHEIQRVVFDNGVVKYVYPEGTEENENLETLYLNPSNVYITSQEVIDNIGEQIIGFEYYNFSTGNCPIDSSVKAGNLLTITNAEDSYKSIMQYEINYNGGWYGGYELNLDSPQQQETIVVGESPEYKSIKVIINREENRLTEIASSVSDNNSRIGALEISDDEINSLVTSLGDNLGELSGSLDEEVQRLQGLINANTTLIQQTAESITSYITKSGGNNLIKNSVGFKDTEYWELSQGAVVNTSQDTDTEQTTTSGSKFIITSGTMRSDYTTIIGTDYTLSFKYKKISLGTPDTSSVKIYKSSSDYVTIFESSEDKSDWEEITFSYTATTSTPYLVIDCGEDQFEISDLIINEGEQQVWSSYKDEIYGKTHQLDSTGLSLSSLESEESSLLDNNSLIFRDSSGITSELSKERVFSNNAEINSTVKIGNFTFQVIDEDNMILF